MFSILINPNSFSPYWLRLLVRKCHEFSPALRNVLIRWTRKSDRGNGSLLKLKVVVHWNRLLTSCTVYRCSCTTNCLGYIIYNKLTMFSKLLTSLVTFETLLFTLSCLNDTITSFFCQYMNHIKKLPNILWLLVWKVKNLHFSTHFDNLSCKRFTKIISYFWINLSLANQVGALSSFGFPLDVILYPRYNNGLR